MIAIPTFHEVSASMYGAWRLARLDRQGMVWFDRTIEGVTRSFWAAILCFPGFIALLALRVSPAEWMQSGAAHILLVESISYVVGWAAFPLIALWLCARIGHEQGGLNFVAAYNWAQILETSLFVIVALIGSLHAVAEPAAEFLGLIALALALGYEWFIARIAVGAGGIAATALILIDLVLGAGLNRVTQDLY